MAKIVIFSFCHGAGSGAERVLEHLLAAAARTPSQPSLTVVAPSYSGVFACSSGLGFETLAWPSRSPSAARNDLPAAIAALPALGGLGATLFHAWHSRCFEIVGTLGMLLGKPVVGTLHDHPQSESSSRARLKLMKFGAGRMRCMACVSEATASACRTAQWNVDLRVVRNGLPAIPAINRTAPRHPLRVGFLGCSEAWKGADFALATASALPEEKFRWNLYGPLTNASSPRLRERIAPNVTLHGRTDPDRIFSENDVVLHPSQRFDPFPTVLLEAARSAIPVVATDVGGSSEIVVDGHTGFLVQPNDLDAARSALTRLANEDTLWKSLSGQARAHFDQNFPVETMLHNYRNLWIDFGG